MKFINSFRFAAAAVVLFAVSVSGARAMPFHDVVIMLDNSGSLGSENFLAQRQAAINLVNDYGGDPGNPMRFAVIDFATNVTVVHGLDGSQNVADVTAALAGLNYTGGWTDTESALIQMMNQFDTFSQGGNTLTGILFTDGQPYTNLGPQSVCHLEAPIKSRGIDVRIVGHGDGWVNQNGQQKTECLVNDPVADILSKTSPLAYDMADYEYMSTTAIIAMAEPGALALFGAGLLTIGVARRRR